MIKHFFLGLLYTIILVCLIVCAQLIPLDTCTKVFSILTSTQSELSDMVYVICILFSSMIGISLILLCAFRAFMHCFWYAKYIIFGNNYIFGKRYIPGPQGPVGPAGMMGKSAFDVWKDATGNVSATEEDFFNDIAKRIK